MFGSIIPAPFAWAERVTPSTRRVTRFGQRSVVVIASEKAVPPPGESVVGGVVDPVEDGLDRQRHPDRPGLGDRDLVVAEAERVGGAADHLEGVLVALLPGLGVGVAAVDDRCPHPALRRPRRGRPGSAPPPRHCG